MSMEEGSVSRTGTSKDMWIRSLASSAFDGEVLLEGLSVSGAGARSVEVPWSGPPGVDVDPVSPIDGTDRVVSSASEPHTVVGRGALQPASAR